MLNLRFGRTRSRPQHGDTVTRAQWFAAKSRSVSRTALAPEISTPAEARKRLALFAAALGEDEQAPGCGTEELASGSKGSRDFDQA